MRLHAGLAGTSGQGGLRPLSASHRMAAWRRPNAGGSDLAEVALAYPAARSAAMLNCLTASLNEMVIRCPMSGYKPTCAL